MAERGPPVVTDPGHRLKVPAGSEFRSEWLDFEHGIRVGRLEPHQRITQILKAALESGFGQQFVTVRWGRGVYWQWIGFFSRANRAAKPVSSHLNFGCAKYFISLERNERTFKAGIQVERGYLKPPSEYPTCRLLADWDWHRFLAHLKRKSELEKHLERLVRSDGFRLFAGSWAERRELSARDFKGAAQLRKILSTAPADDWCGFQVYYPLPREDVQSMSGIELLECILAIFSEVTPVMNRCMQVELG